MRKCCTCLYFRFIDIIPWLFFFSFRFKDHVKKNSPQRILDAEEFFNLRNEVLNEIKASKAELESKISDDAPPGEEAPDYLDKVSKLLVCILSSFITSLSLPGG